MAANTVWIDPTVQALNPRRGYLDADGDFWICREGQWLYGTDIEEDTAWSVDDPKDRPVGPVMALSEVSSEILLGID